MELREYLAVPYKLQVYSARGPDGRWHRYAEYAEIDCVSEGETPMAAMEELEQRRVDFIVERLSSNQEVPVPRPPLLTTIDSFSEEYLDEIAQRIVRAAHAAS
jgi:hypothetical protein